MLGRCANFFLVFCAGLAALTLFPANLWAYVFDRFWFTPAEVSWLLNSARTVPTVMAFAFSAGPLAHRGSQTC